MNVMVAKLVRIIKNVSQRRRSTKVKGRRVQFTMQHSGYFLEYRIKGGGIFDSKSKKLKLKLTQKNVV